MTAMLFVILSLISVVRHAISTADHLSESTRLPDPDGNLNIHVIPTGLGDAHIIQCPDGVLSIIDMGTFNTEKDGFWRPNDIKKFLQGQDSRIQSIMISHNHWDHASFLPPTFQKGDLISLKQLYISCRFENMDTRIKEWVDNIGVRDKIRSFNNGQACGARGPTCGELDLCPNSTIHAIAMAANLINCTGDANPNSIVFKLMYGSFSVLFTGDFADRTTDWGEDGPQRWLIDSWKHKIESTIYKVAHHGSDEQANKPVMLNAVKPKAIIVASDPYHEFKFNYPRCSVFDHFITKVGTLCKPAIVNVRDDQYCGEPLTQAPPSARIQTNYTCGTSGDSKLETRISNDFAIYTTTPDQNTQNVITISSDGQKWQVTPSIQIRNV